MLDGWYCRSIANQNAVEQNDRDDENEPNVVDDSDESQDVPAQHMMPRVDYKSQYHTLKKKLKFLLYVSTTSGALLAENHHFDFRKTNFSKTPCVRVNDAF